MAKLPEPGDLAAFKKVTEAASTLKGVVAVSPVIESPSGRAAVAQIYPSTAPQAVQTTQLLHELRDSVIPAAEAGTGLHVLVGGVTAAGVDFSAILASKLALFIGVVVVVAFLLLMLVFRSLLIPAVASVMNLLSVGAALGVDERRVRVGMGIVAVRDQPYRPGRGVHPCHHVLCFVRALHGLRGFPGEPDARRMDQVA